ncbi:MAG TPA: hypothetical protein QGH10_14010 [Armatimonadota bacterium]|nr:hypothetical protein [Armatimonadota bacterium]
MNGDGIGHPAITIQAHELLSTVCQAGGVECPLMCEHEAEAVLERIKSDPTVTIRLVSPADEIPHYTESIEASDIFNRKRDLDVLQRLGLVPGSIRRARYLYTLLFERIETPDGICAYDTPGWEGCPLAKSGAYESVRERGWSSIVYDRPQEEIDEYRARSEAEAESGEGLHIRPHHLMCMSCWYNGGEGKGPRPNDTLYEIFLRIREQPDVPITLVQGCCMACDCCEGFHPQTGRCVHAGGLIRDYKKDLDCFQKLGMKPGDTMPANELLALIYERIPSTKDLCGYGDGIVRSEEWWICSDPDGNPQYEATRKAGIF